MEEASQVLKRALPDARLHRIPRHPSHRDVVLAILCLGMRRRYPYSEIEMNDYLKSALSRLRAEVDHVTCRRYLVDLGFVKRDRAGARYLVNFPKLEATLSAEVMENAKALVDAALKENARRPRE